MTEEYFNNKRVLHSRLYPMVFYPEHHKADKDGFVNIHQLVAEQILGRDLTDDECVHHVDLNKNNYSKDNIWVFASKSDHNNYHAILNNKNIDYVLIKLNNIYYCRLYDYAANNVLKSVKQMDDSKSSKKVKICPKCGKAMTIKAKTCLDCMNREKNKNIPAKEDLERIIFEKQNFCAVARMYGVSDNAVRKWCKKYNLPFRTKDLKEEIKKNKD